jgi:phage nucleotide-binding protein
MNKVKMEDMTMDDTNLCAVIYGLAGCGKTDLLRWLPRPMIVLDWDQKYHPLLGEKDIDIVSYKMEKNEDSKALVPQFWRDINLLRKEKEYKTYVVDSVTSLNRCLERWTVMMCGKGKAPGDRATLQEYGDMKRWYNTFFPSLLGMPGNVILLAHEQSKTDDKGNLLSIRPLITGSMGDELSSIYPHTFHLEHIAGSKERWRLYYQKHQKFVCASSVFSGGVGYIEYGRGEDGYSKLMEAMKEHQHGQTS